MQTELPGDFLATESGREADSILRACVHCGFCMATCPTYLLTGNELDGPRGRIYLVKSMLEGAPVSRVTRTHLDRCLTCQSCETTCPSGVNYHRLLDIGRREVERQVPRTWASRLFRQALQAIMSRRRLFTPLVQLGLLVRPLIPSSLRHYLPRRRASLSGPSPPGPAAAHSRRVILVQGCVQPGLSPTTNQATTWVLDKLGIETVSVSAETCCGALAYHMNSQQRGLAQARRNIDAWWPLLEAGAEAIVMNASGCSNFVQEYADLLRADPAYAGRAERVVASLEDISSFLLEEDLEALRVTQAPRISWHCPCTAQHGQKLDGPTRTVLERFGFEVPEIRDAHLCCGSAGTYSLFEPDTAIELRRRKLQALDASRPQHIVTANIGCQTHLAGGTEIPVVHWIELVARQLQS